MTSRTPEVHALVEAIRPFFIGQRGETVGDALADLVSIWLAGHVIPDDLQLSHRVQERLLRRHMKTVRRLIPVNYWTEIEPRFPRPSEAGASHAKLDS
jgi:hypothetical protein